MKTKLRNSGIDVIGNVPWGTHFCQFYQTKEDLSDIPVPYFKAGLENNEFCVWVTSELLNVKEAKEALRKSVPNLDNYLEKGQIEIISYADWYIKDGIFDSQRALNGLIERVNKSLASGYNGLRLIESIYWLEKESRNDFINYEKRMDSVIGKYPIIALCTYSQDMCSAIDIMDIVANHQFSLIKREGKWEQIENSGRKSITECKRTEQALQESEERYKAIFDNSIDAIFITSPDGTIHAANPAACQMFRMTEEEIIRAGRNGTVDTSDPRLKSMLEERARTGRFKGELNHRRKDGTIFTGEITSSFFKDSNRIVKTVIIIRDITERKKAEEALQKSEEHYRMLFTNMTEGFYLAEMICNKDGKPYDYRYLEINPAYEFIMGVRREQILGKSILEVFPNASPIGVEKLCEVALSGQSAHFEMFSQVLDKYLDIYAFSPEKGKLAAIIRDITERKQMEKELQENEEKYRNIVETAIEGIWIGDSEARTTYVNNKMAEMLGYTQGEMIGRSGWDFTYKENKAAVKKHMEKRKQGIDESYEFKLIRKDGSPLWTLISAKSLFDKNGKFIGSMKMLTDITKRKETEAKLKETLDNLENLVKERTVDLEKAYNSLKESEKGLAEAQKMAHIGNWERDILADKAYWSDELYRIFGRSPRELAPTSNEYLNYVHPDDRDYVNNAYMRAINGKPRGINHRIVLANGEVRTIHIQSEVIYNEENIPIRAKGTVQDITEREKAEENIRRLANIVESSNDAIITESLDGIITSWNKGAEQIYGYSAEEIIGKPISILEPSIIAEETKKLAELVKQGEMIQQYETLRLRKDGTAINVSITLSPVFEIHGKLTAVSVIYRDITKRKEAEVALEKIQEAHIKEIHHRIKNNLQVISSLLSLEAEKFSDAKILESFRESQNRVASMALIHEELYKGDKIDTLNFAAYLQKLTADLFCSYNLGNNGTSLKLDVEQVYLGMDIAIPLGIIINELISNSLKHAFPNRKAGEIYISLCKTETFTAKNDFHYILTVADNGIGIPEEIEFPDMDSLGLQLVNILVEQIDGCVELNRDEGTKFSIWFSNTEK